MTTAITGDAKETTSAATGTEATKDQQTADAKAGTTTEAKPDAGTKADATKTEDTKGTAKVVPDKYDLKLPEGSLLDPSAIERHAQRAKELKLSNEEAQKELDRDHETVKSYVEGQKAQLKKQSEEWVKAAQSDAEIGGSEQKLKESSELARRALKAFDTSGSFSQFLDETGLGNHPDAIRVFAKIGRAMGEDKLIHGGAAPAGTRTLEDRLYGGTKE